MMEMIDIDRPTKPTARDPLEKAGHDFVILVMAKLLEKEFQAAHIFANHPNWENGPWEAGFGHRTPDVALGEREKQRLIAVYEVETDLSVWDMTQIISDLELLGDIGDIPIELVVPQSKLEQTKKELHQIPIQGFWTYTINRHWKVTVNKDPENKSKILKTIVSSDPEDLLTL